MVVLSKEDVIGMHDLPTEIRGNDRDMSFRSNHLIESDSEILPDYRKTKRDLIEGFERNYLKRLLEKNQWNISQSAREMKMHRSSFQRLVRKYGLRGRS